MGKLKDSIKNLGIKINGVEPQGYYTTELLKDFGETLTGSTINGKTITDIINGIANNYVPSLGLKITPIVDDSIDLLGKVASDLQENIAIADGGISGTLKYVASYNGFQRNAKGNFIALHAEANQEGATITAEIIGGTSGQVTLDEDGIWIGKIASNEQSIQFIVTKDNVSKTYTFTLNDLVLTQEPQGEE